MQVAVSCRLQYHMQVAVSHAGCSITRRLQYHMQVAVSHTGCSITQVAVSHAGCNIMQVAVSHRLQYQSITLHISQGVITTANIHSIKAVNKLFVASII